MTDSVDADNAKQSTDPKPVRKQRMRVILRLLGKGLLLLLGLLFLLRVTHPLWLPRVLDRLAATQGFQLQYEDMDLSLLGGRLDLTRLTLLRAAAGEEAETEPSPEDALAVVDYIGLDLDLSALLTGQLRVHRAEIDGVSVLVARDEGGNWNFSGPETDELATQEPSQTSPGDAANEASKEELEPAAIDFRLPLAIDAAVLHGVRVVLEDRFVDPPLDTFLTLDVAARDLGDSDRPARVSVQALSPELLGVLRLELQAETGERLLDATGSLQIEDLGLGRLAPYLVPLGLTPQVDGLSCCGSFRAQLAPKLDSEVDLAGSLELSDLSLHADGQESLALDSLSIDIAAGSQRNVRLDRVALVGLRGGATRDPVGRLHIAGLRLDPGPAEEANSGAAQVDEAQEPDASAASLALEVARVELSESGFHFVDQAVQPAAVLELEVWSELRNLVLDPRRPGLPLQFSLGLGLVEGDQVLFEGELVPDPADFSLAADCTAQNLSLDALRPYLQASGWESSLRDGRLEFPLQMAGKLDDGLSAELSLGPLQFTDGPQELLAFERLALVDLNSTSNGDLRLGDAVLTGLRTGARLEQNGGLAVLGLRSFEGGRSPSAAPELAAPEQVQEQAPSTAPSDAQDMQPGPNGSGASARFVLDHLGLEDCVLSLESDRCEPPLDLRLTTALSLNGLELGGEPGDAPPQPAQLSLDLQAEGLVDEFHLGGSLLARPGPLDLQLDLELRAAGLKADAVAGLLAEAGFEGTLSSGSVGGDLSLELRSLDEGLQAEVELRQLALQDQGRELMALDRLHVDDLAQNSTGVSIAAIHVEGPRAELARRADGRLELPGLRSLPTKVSASGSSPKPAGKAAGNGNGNATGSVDAVQSVQTVQSAPENEGASPVFALGILSLEGARLGWRDAAVSPPVELALLASANLQGLSTAKNAAPLRFDLATSLGEGFNELVVDGQARVEQDRLTCDLNLNASALRAGPLASYFPPGLESTLQDGQFGLHLVASSTANGTGTSNGMGGRALEMQLSDLELRDGQESLLAVDNLHIAVPRFDPKGEPSPRTKDSEDTGETGDTGEQADGGFIDIDELTLEGLELGLEQTQEGLEFLGLRLRGQDQMNSPGDPAAQVEGQEVARAPEDAVAGETPASTGPSAAGPSAVEALPTLRLGRLQIGPSQLTYLDRVSGGEPLELALTFGADEPQLLLSPEPEELPPLHFFLAGAAAPLLGSFRSDVELNPFAGEPSLRVSVRADGLHGQELTRVLPDLASKLDAGEWDDGSLEAELEAVLQVTRRGPMDFGLGRGFGGQIALTHVLAKPTPEADAALGFERLDIDLQRFVPATGEAHLKTIELVGSRARIRQEVDGLRIAGLLFKTPAPTSQEEGTGTQEQGESAPADAATPQIPPGELAQAVPNKSPELRLDELLVTGLDFQYEDATVEPAFRLPIGDLELEVQGLTTKALEEPRSVSFRALLEAGEVQLPERGGQDNLLAGVLGSLTDVVTGSDEKFASEPRRLWDQLELDGRVALFPSTKGRASLVLSGLELPAFRGLAQAAGVEIGDGLVDSKLDLRLRGEEGVALNLQTTLDSLSLSEPADGPISQYLRLPAPLDTVLFLLRNEEGQQEIPLRVNVPAQGLSAGAVAGAAATALGTMIIDALSSAPARMLGPLTSLVGELGLSPEPPSAQTVRLAFAPGTTLLAREVAQEIEPLIESLRANPTLRLVVQHELGSADIDCAERLANPDPAQAMEFVTRLRTRKAAITKKRAELSARTRARWAVGATGQAQEDANQLKRLDREMLDTEEALDRVLALTRPGADRRRGQRTRLAALSLARERMRLLEQLIEREGGRGLASQIDLRRPRFKTPADTDSATDQKISEFGSVSLTPRLGK